MKLKQIQKIAKILSSLEQKEPKKREEALDYLLQRLKKENKLSLLTVILKETEKEIKKEQNFLILARENISKRLKTKIKEKIATDLESSGKVEIKVDSNIIGGFILKTKNYLIDGSVKGILRRIKNKELRI